MTVEGSSFAMNFAVDGQVFIDWGDGMYLYDEYADTVGVFEGMYLDCAGLTDYTRIPMSWKSQAE